MRQDMCDEFERQGCVHERANGALQSPPGAAASSPLHLQWLARCRSTERRQARPMALTSMAAAAARARMVVAASRTCPRRFRHPSQGPSHASRPRGLAGIGGARTTALHGIEPEECDPSCQDRFLRALGMGCSGPGPSSRSPTISPLYQAVKIKWQWMEWMQVPFDGCGDRLKALRL